MLQVEISTIYKKGNRTRKVHHLIYVPDLDAARRLVERLSAIGNLKSDGRPILGLDSRHLLEITLDSGAGSYLIPAHIWTPWFAVLGSNSGFDAVEDCYADLTSHIFALETGLSSDPPMNWRLSQLDGYTLVSNSDAHSPPKIGREACVFDTGLDYFSIRRALETGQGYLGTVEFFPEEGKYHLDGHRKCGVRLGPEETRRLDGLCPVCGKNLTVGVMNRVDELADRPAGYAPDGREEFRSLVPLPEVISELRGVGEKSKQVQQTYEQLIRRVGSELFILQEAPLEDLRSAASPLLADAVQRMRAGQVICEAGYDGQYGVIRLFERHEITRGTHVSLLFDLPEPASDHQAGYGDRVAESSGLQPSAELNQSDVASPAVSDPHDPEDPAGPRATAESVRSPESSGSRADGNTVLSELLRTLDDDQRAAAEILCGPLLIVAGPGTGKTRTLTHRIAHLIADHGVAPEACLAITFSRRAAAEMSERLVTLLADRGRLVAVMTFHALGLAIVRDHLAALGLSDSTCVADEQQRKDLLIEHWGLSDAAATRFLRDVSKIRRGRGLDTAANTAAIAPAFRDHSVDDYLQLMRQRGWLDFDDLILLPADLLVRHPELAEQYRMRWRWVSVDEYQDIDDSQYRLIRLLVSADGNLCAIGDPDQSIYGFRGANPQVFLDFARDFPAARVVQLTRNYRSSQTIVQAAVQAITPTSLVSDRILEAFSGEADRIQIHTAASDRAEAEHVVHAIERLIGGSTFFSLDSGRVASHEGQSLSFADFAVLYRTDAQAEPLVEALARSGIPFQRHSHHRLIDTPAVQALQRRLRQETERSTGDMTTVVERLKQAADEVWERHSEIVDYLDILAAQAERHGENLTGFLDEMVLGLDADRWDPRADRVSLMTLHASKGLEFPVVFLVGCEDGVLPLYWGSSDDADLAEERRLFFVGITRARSRLYLSHAKRRRWRGKVREMNPSPFLQAIRDELLERERITARRKAKSSSDRQLELF